ncbi:MAG: RtcB family protein, partial [Actinobacteria bacterium]|nr:RtcB family protein [Actinomycetota bacterium]
IYVGAGQRGVIPGSMGQKSYVVRGNVSDSGALADSYFSASHGAGRVLGRKAAKRQLGADAWDKMDGVTWQSAQADALLDEAPGAYKNIDEVMEAQKDLVQVDHVLRAVLNYKGL